MYPSFLFFRKGELIGFNRPDGSRVYKIVGWHGAMDLVKVARNIFEKGICETQVPTAEDLK